MMIFDSTNKFSDSQAVTASAASENVIDLGVSGRDIGVGHPACLHIEVDEDFATLTSLNVSLQTDDDEAFGSAVTVVSTGEIALADLVNGYVFAPIHLPKNIDGQYVRLYYTVTGTDATAGSITAGIVMGNQLNG